MHAFKSGLDWFCLRGTGYQFWSGIGSGSPLLAVFAAYWHHHNCHVDGCKRLGHVLDGRPVCKRHHS